MLSGFVISYELILEIQYAETGYREMKFMHRRKWLGRVLIGTVLFINVQCALLFLLIPKVYVPGFELEGGAGNFYVRGIGLLFLMWNVPYFVAVLDPLKYRVSLYEATVMQAIGLVGETLLLLSLPVGHLALHNTVRRFILFDAVGLVLLLLTVWVTRVTNECEKPIESSS
ncbi:hypothetical protein ACFLV7_12610 [Chloroflexota bacterium]